MWLWILMLRNWESSRYENIENWIPSNAYNFGFVSISFSKKSYYFSMSYKFCCNDNLLRTCPLYWKHRIWYLRFCHCNPIFWTHCLLSYLQIHQPTSKVVVWINIVFYWWSMLLFPSVSRKAWELWFLCSKHDWASRRLYL